MHNFRVQIVSKVESVLRNISPPVLISRLPPSPRQLWNYGVQWLYLEKQGPPHSHSHISQLLRCRLLLGPPIPTDSGGIPDLSGNVGTQRNPAPPALSAGPFAAAFANHHGPRTPLPASTNSNNVLELIVTFWPMVDSKDFEPSKKDTLDIVYRFIVDKSTEGLQLKDRLHTAWLCTRTPFSDSRVLETGDEEFLKLAHERNIPVVVMLTHYDTFVNSFEEHCDKCKNYESCEKCKNTETSEKHEGAETCENCKKAAKDGYDGYVQALEKAVTRLNIPMPECINVSLREGYTQNPPVRRQD
ncbi:hypothetical protein B0H13DRAFT_1916184 [Mycena leptocephala]|nr:hypothetical protein B0H13DRAFT_1916184 [Mycena leptocephala]